MSIFEKLGKSVADEFVRKLHEGSVTGLNMTNQVVDGAQSLIDVAADVVDEAGAAVDTYLDYAEDLLSDLSNFLEGFKEKSTETVRKNEKTVYGTGPKDGCPAGEHFVFDTSAVDFKPEEKRNNFDFDATPDVDKLTDISSVSTTLLNSDEMRSYLANYYNVNLNVVEQLTKDWSDARLTNTVYKLRSF